MSRPIVVSKALATAASASKVCAAQQTLAAGDLLINGGGASGGVATLDSQRQILFTTLEDDSTVTWTMYGTDDNGNVIVDTGLLPNHTTGVSNLSFKTVTRISVSAAISANITVGTNGVGSSPWQLFDPYLTPSYLSLVLQLVSGTSNATVEYTADAISNSTQMQSAVGYGFTTPQPFAIAHPSLQSIAATTEGAIDFPIRGWRLTINSGTGAWKLTGYQSGLIQ